MGLIWRSPRSLDIPRSWIDSPHQLDALADNPEFVSALRAGGIETLHTLETTLEDVFVQVIGRPSHERVRDCASLGRSGAAQRGEFLPIAAYFLPTPAQYLAGVIPTYWPMRAFWSASQQESYSVYLAIGCLAGAFALAVAVRLFERQLLRRA